MIKSYGSGEEWQRQKTIEWIRRIKAEDLVSTHVILDGQARQAFVEGGVQSSGVIRLSNRSF
jgi:hypothetical protein